MARSMILLSVKMVVICGSVVGFVGIALASLNSRTVITTRNLFLVAVSVRGPKTYIATNTRGLWRESVAGGVGAYRFDDSNDCSRMPPLIDIRH